MKRSLKDCVKLHSRVCIYIADGEGRTAVIGRVICRLAEWFGGATATKAMGAWIMGNGELMKERVELIMAYCREMDLEAHIEELYDLALWVKREMKQEAVALEVNGEMYFV